MATSHDGAEVPISLLHRRDLKRDGSAPLLLYGYGSYGMSIPASSTPTALAGRSRLRVCDRAYSRRTDKGWGLVSRRQAREEDQQL